MKLFELFSKLAVRAGKVVVVNLELRLVLSKFTFDLTHKLFISLSSLLELFLSAGVDCLALFENFLVEIKLLFIQTINSFHVFHTFLENLHFLFKLNLLVSLVVSIL